ncbi:putative cbiG [Burkholderia sp. ABCPW 111]|nr:putative cbiG [Burkholderia sp. ABCPW 111]
MPAGMRRSGRRIARAMPSLTVAGAAQVGEPRRGDAPCFPFDCVRQEPAREHRNASECRRAGAVRQGGQKARKDDAGAAGVAQHGGWNTSRPMAGRRASGVDRRAAAEAARRSEPRRISRHRAPDAACHGCPARERAQTALARASRTPRRRPARAAPRGRPGRPPAHAALPAPPARRDPGGAVGPRRPPGAIRAEPSALAGRERRRPLPARRAPSAACPRVFGAVLSYARVRCSSARPARSVKRETGSGEPAQPVLSPQRYAACDAPAAFAHSAIAPLSSPRTGRRRNGKRPARIPADARGEPRSPNARFRGGRNRARNPRSMTRRLASRPSMAEAA